MLVSTPNLDENRHVASLHTVDVASGAHAAPRRRAKTTSACRFRAGRLTVNRSPFWRRERREATRPQVFVVASQGGDAKQITTAPSGVQQIAWSPDSRTIGFASADEPEKKPGYQRWNDSFEVQPNFHLFMTAPVPPTHVWMVPAAGGDAKRLTSGDWTLPVTRPPGAPSSMITWTPDGGGDRLRAKRRWWRRRRRRRILHAVSIADGDGDSRSKLNGTHPPYSPNSEQIAFLNNAAVVRRRPAAASVRNLTQAIDRGIARALWMPDGKSLIVGGNDTERVSLWQQPLDGPAKKLDTGDASPELVVLRGHGGEHDRRDRVRRHVADAAGGAVLHGVAGRAGAAAHRRQRRDRVAAARQVRGGHATRSRSSTRTAS